ncbi:MAG: GTP-binding protein [Oligoflexales bacterium]|nr:GTP-binding protein [Oligoflexales bacterium]
MARLLKYYALMLLVGALFGNAPAWAKRKVNASMLGSSAVGKTTLLRQLKGSAFTPVGIATIGFDFFKYTTVIDLDDYEFMILDTPGLMRFRSAIPNIVKSHLDLVILVFDVSDRHTFEELDFFKGLAHSMRPQAPVLIVGNQIDSSSREV